MEIYRLAREKYGMELSGKGAAKFGARWNSKGTEMVYCASNRSLAMAEVAVHFTLTTLPKDYMLMTIRVPDSVAMATIDVKKLPDGWNTWPSTRHTQRLGDQFVDKGEACLLLVPSAVTKGDTNVLLNPFHKDFKKVKLIEWEPFPFDTRIFR